MKKSYYIVFLFLSFFNFSLNAQAPELLKAEGRIPKEFITSSTIKFKKQVEEIGDKKKGKRRDAKNQKRFILESNFEIDDVLQSGQVLFNDPATVYVNKVLGKLTYTDRKLKKKKPRAYVLNSAAVNAFATDQGIIFVTLGLLANLQNEAQLAFVLSHELIHIKHQHSINKFVKSKEIDRRNGQNERNVDRLTVDRNLFKKSMYSKKLEEQADDEGFEIFLSSPYDPQVISNTFKILHYSYLPFEDYEFPSTFFNDENYELPADLWLKEVNAISAMKEDKEEDKKSSHPSSLKRLEKMEKQISGVEAEGKKTFVFPEKEFFDIQARARYQIPFLNLYAENFPEAIYTAFLMFEDFPNDLELKKVIGKALYMEAKYQNEDGVNLKKLKRERRRVVKELEGSVQRVYHFLNEIDQEELTILALKYNWNVLQEAKGDEELKAIVEDLSVEFAGFHRDFDSFLTSARPAKSTTEPVPPKEEKKEEEEKDTDKKTSKFDKIERAEEEADYWKYAFVEELKKAQFKKQCEEGLEKLEEREDREAFYETDKGRKEWRADEKREAKKGKQLGINKIVVVNPFYLSLNEGKEGTIQYIRSEEKQVAFRNSLKEISKVSDLKIDVLDVTDLSTNDIEKFNDINEVNHYFSQQMSHFDLSLTSAYNQKETNAIAEKYGTDYFLWTGVISLKEKNKGQWSWVGLSVLVPYFLPLTLANALTPKYDMLYYAILFDVTTGRRSVVKMDYFDKRDTKTILNAHIYDVFHQIKSKE